MKPEEVAKLQAQGSAQTATAGGSFGIGKGGFDAKATMFWAFVGLPLASFRTAAALYSATV